MIRITLFLLGFGFSAIGFMYMILYLNLFSIGYTIKEYLIFVLSRYECVLGLIGFVVLTFTIFYKGDKKHDICV